MKKTELLLVLLFLVSLPAFAQKEKDFRTLIDQAGQYAKIQEYELATDYALKGRDAARTDAQRSEALSTLSGIDLMTWRDSSAWVNACEAEKIARSAKAERETSLALIQKGRMCSYCGVTAEENRDDEALGYFTEALQIAERIGDPAIRIEVLYNLSQIYVNKNRFNNPIDPQLYSKAGEYLEQGKTLAKKEGLKDLENKALHYEMRYLRQGGRTDDAIACCREILDECDGKDYLMRSQVWNQLVMLYALKDDVKSSAEAHQKYVYSIEHYMRQKADALLQDMEARYENKLQQEKIRSRNIALILLAVLTALLIFHAVMLFRSYRLTRQQNRSLEELNRRKNLLLAFISKEFATKEADDAQIRALSERIVAGDETLGIEEDVQNLIRRLHDMRSSAGKDLGLTPREMEIIRLSREGLSNAKIAEKLFISVYTVNNHKQNIYSKLDVRSNAEMLYKAEKLGL